jgi:hypothetical protein
MYKCVSGEVLSHPGVTTVCSDRLADAASIQAIAPQIGLVSGCESLTGIWVNL